MSKVLRLLYLTLVLNLLFFSANAQTYSRLYAFQSHPELDTLFRKADSLRSYLDIKSSNQLYDEISRKYQATHIKQYCQLAKADNFLRHRQTEAAKAQLLKLKETTAVSNHFKIDETYLWAIYYYQVGQYDTSLVLFKKLEKNIQLSSKNALFYGEYLNSFGELYYHGFSDFQSALSFYNNAVRIWENQLDLKHYCLARVYYNLGNAYDSRSELSLLTLYAKKALDIANLFSERYPRFKFVCYSLLTASYSKMNNESEAIKISLDQLDFAIKHRLDDNLIDYTYNNISEYLLEDRQYQNSMKYNKILLDRLSNTNYTSIQTLSAIYPIALRRQAICLSKLEKIEEAYQFHQKSLAANAKYYGVKSRRYAQAWRYYSEFLTEQNQTTAALSAIDSSITIYEYKWKQDKDVSYLYGLMLGLFQKGLIFNIQKKNQNALKCFIAAGNYMDSIRINYFLDETQLDFSASAKSIYENIVVTAQQMFLQIKDSSYLESIYFAIESNKYQTLWQKLQEKSLWYVYTRDQNLLDSLSTIDKYIEALNTKIQQKKGNETQHQLEIARWIESKDNLTSKNSIVSFSKNTLLLNQFQQQLAANEIIIELFEGDSICHGLIIQKNKSTYFKFKITKDYKLYLNEFKRVLAGHDLTTTAEKQLANYFELATKVSEPFNKTLSKILLNQNIKYKITIIPDGRFIFLPFEAFLMAEKSEGQKQEFSSLPYWIKKYDINYSISAKFYLQNKANTTLGRLKTVFAIGPKRSAILLSAEKEVKMIDKLFGRNSTIALTNQRNVLKLKQFDNLILHIAGHAVIDTLNYNQSFLHFGEELEDSLKIFDFEISNLNIRVPLVILNACETFKGKEYKGEGVYNLNQSFLLGGAASVISTLWKIEDKSASMFMEEFYSRIKKGYTINRAVNDTKRTIIETSNNAHPFYWAAYLYNGDSPAIYNSFKIKRNLYLIGVVSIAMIMMIGGFIYHRRRQN
jgi:CHAT domain-containing protein